VLQALIKGADHRQLEIRLAPKGRKNALALVDRAFVEAGDPG
jgi:hypothetical protein